MNGRNAKMLRRLRQDTKVGKSVFNDFSAKDKALIRADYTERGETARTQYTKAKKLAIKEIVDNQVVNKLSIEDIDKLLKATRIPKYVPSLQPLYIMNRFKNRRLQ